MDKKRLYSFGDHRSLEKGRKGNVGATFVFNRKTENLEMVDLSGNVKLREIIFETPQDKLRYLDASRCAIEKITFPAGYCNNLQTLYLQKNRLKSITFEGDLPALEFIDVSENELTEFDLPFAFKHLENLYLYKNRLTNILSLQSFFLRDDFDFVITENPGLVSPPVEIVNQGAEAVINYFLLLQKEQKEKAAPLYNFEVKLLLIGEGGTGKTTMLRKLKDVNASLPEDKDTTYGIAIEKWTYDIYRQLFPQIHDLKQDQMLVNCWDFGGQKIYHGTHQIFFGENSFYILVADTREGHTDFTYWFNTIEQLAGENAAVLVLINQKYGHVLKFDIDGYRSRYHFLLNVVELDLDNKGGNDKVKTECILKLRKLIETRLQEMPRIGVQLSATYVRIREDLFILEENFISFDDFRRICKKHELTDLQSICIMSKYFHEIGAITHFIDDPLLRQKVFINSDWLVKTIYKVLDNKTIKQKHGRIRYSDFSHIWAKENLDFEIDHLTRIMHNFGLMYQVTGTKEYVIPAHLPTAKPYMKWIHLDLGAILTFKYEFDKYMPEGLMSHFIVALNELIENQDYVWSLGVNIKYEDTFAEIIDTYGGTNTFLINIAGKNRKGLLEIIRNKFKEILKPFKKLIPLEKVPCRCDVCKSNTDPFFHEYNALKNLLEKRSDVLCTKSGLMVLIQEILDNVERSKDDRQKQESDYRSIPPETPKSPVEIKVFLSYSSNDRNLRDLLVKGLKGHLAKKEKIKYTIWSDKEIDIGSDWRNEIELALKQSRAAILLVSGSFVSSEFIVENELAEFFRRKKSEGFIIFPILARSFDFSEFAELSSLQFFKTYYNEYSLDDDGNLRNEIMPFDELGEGKNIKEKQRQDYYFRLARHIHEAVSKQI